MEPTVRRLDARSLRGLAHPLRLRILDALRLDGPSNSSHLAARFGENTGTVSWHLRQLARHGFIEEDIGRGDHHERWWRAPTRKEVLDTSELDPAAVSGVVEELLRWSFGRVTEYLQQDWPKEWREAGIVAEWTELRLTTDQLRELTERLTGVVEEYLHAQPEPEALAVVVQLQAFPRKPAQQAQ